MCFSPLWLAETAVWAVKIVVAVLILRLVVPYIISLLSGAAASAIVMRVINLIVGAIVLIALIWLLYDLWACAALIPRSRPF